MRKYFKSFLYLSVASYISFSAAGSYEDFFQAVKQDDAATIQSLLRRGFDPDTRDPKGLTGLYLALREPSLKAANTLIDWPKTNVEVRNEQDESPLMMAALKGHLGEVKKLIAKGADVNKPGWAPLHYAATNGHTAIMSLLLEHYAFIDATSPNGTTPLMMAASYGSPAAVKLLLDEGADTDMKNMQGLSAINFAQRASRQEVVEMITAAIRAKQPKGKW
jgi:uncharacterized protein